MNTADAEQKRELAEVNAAYEQRFGRIYLVAAAGLSAAELLAKAQARLAQRTRDRTRRRPRRAGHDHPLRLTDWLGA